MPISLGRFGYPIRSLSEIFGPFYGLLRSNSRTRPCGLRQCEFARRSGTLPFAETGPRRFQEVRCWDIRKLYLRATLTRPWKTPASRIKDLKRGDDVLDEWIKNAGP